MLKIVRSNNLNLSRRRLFGTAFGGRTRQLPAAFVLEEDRGQHHSNNGSSSSAIITTKGSSSSSRRWMSSNSTNDQSAKGPQPRKRFYAEVGVKEVASPWESRFAAATATALTSTAPPTLKASGNNQITSNKSLALEEEKEELYQESPISAGVDGTQSASGVIGHLNHLDDAGDGSAATTTTTTELSQQEQIELLRERLIPRCCDDDAPAPAPAPAPADDDKNNSNDNHHLKWYSVTLDGRTLKTPLGQILAVPSELLAWAIAAEWDAQTKQIRPVQMPLMTLTCTALDQTASHPKHYQDMALQYLPTDTTCFWADAVEDRVLHRHQSAAWKELHEFIEKELKVKPAMAMGAQESVLMSRRNKDTGTIGLPHPPLLVDACVERTSRLDAWHLTALNAIAAETKSFLVAYAVLHPSSPFSTSSENDNNSKSKSSSLANAIRAARVEEEFQIESWGLVEGQHDYDRLNCSVQIRSAKLLTEAVLQQSK